jgi:hypothetical protein
MSTYPTKYIKLATQPWTGNGITDPTETITIDGSQGSSPITLSQVNSGLLINGFPAASSSQGVSSLTVNPPLTASGTVGDIILGLPTSSEMISAVVGTNGISASGPIGDIIIGTQGGVTNIIPDSFDLEIIPGDKVNDPWVINSFSNIGTTSEFANVIIDQLPFNSGPIPCPNQTGIYLVELYNANGSLQTVSTLGRSNGSGVFRCSMTASNQAISEVTPQRILAIYTQPNVMGQDELYIQIGTEYEWNPGQLIQVNFFRIL